MKRLNFRLAEWAPRTTWASTDAREVWEPRIQKISQVWQEVEREAVYQGVKPSVLQVVDAEGLPGFIIDVANHGSVALPLAQTGSPVGYASGPMQGPLTSYKVVVTQPGMERDWIEAWQKSDDSRIGELLGYPKCCQQFFQKYWNQEKWFDTTIPQANGLEIIKQTDRYCNLLWRWHGIRLVSHLACRFDCAETHRLGEQMLYVFEKVDMEASRWAFDILDWPVLYTSLHGIAEITTPVHRTAVATDALAEKHSVKYVGQTYPEEGAQGGFPHRMSWQKPSQNGFSSKAAQDAAHQELLRVLGPTPFGTVLDLGCGDGLLLSRIPAAKRIGVEKDPERAAAAKSRIDHVIIGDVTDEQFVTNLITEIRPSLVIAQKDRNPAERLNAPFVLSYTYEGTTSAQLLAPPNHGHRA